MHPAPPILVDRAQDYTPKHSISARRDTLDRRAATLPGAAVRSRCEDPHQVSLPWQPTFEQVRVDGFQLPAPPKLTFVVPFTWSAGFEIVFDPLTTSAWQLAHASRLSVTCFRCSPVMGGLSWQKVQSVAQPGCPAAAWHALARDPRGAAREVLPVARAAGGEARHRRRAVLARVRPRVGVERAAGGGITRDGSRGAVATGGRERGERDVEERSVGGGHRVSQ